MAQPSLGEAIGLQGRTQIAEQLGKMSFQIGEAEKNRAIKTALAQQKQYEKALEKFSIPTKDQHRLVLPLVQQTVVETVNKANELKQKYPNTWQNALPNLINSFEQKMSEYNVQSADLKKYDAMSEILNKNNTYFTKNQQKFNSEYEVANDWYDLQDRLKKQNWQPDNQLAIRPNGSVSFTPFPKQNVKKDIATDILTIPLVPYRTTSGAAAIGKKEQTVTVRPITRQKSQFGPSSQDIREYNPTAYKSTTGEDMPIPSIEDKVDNYLLTNKLGVAQYADEYDLAARFNPDGSLIEEDYNRIKSHIMDWAKDLANPKMTTSYLREPARFSVSTGTKETGNIAAPVYDPSAFSSTPTGVKSIRAYDLNYSFLKEPVDIPATKTTMFSSDFAPVTGGTVSLIPTGAVLMFVDKNGNPVKYSENEALNMRDIAGIDLFVRGRAGTESGPIYYTKMMAFSDINNKLGSKADDTFKSALKDLFVQKEAYKKHIEDTKKKKNYTYDQLIKIR